MQRIVNVLLGTCIGLAIASSAHAEVSKPAPVVQNPENLVPTAAQLDTGRQNYVRYCSDCHGKEGEGKTGPKLVGSLIVTGPINGHLAVVLQDKSHIKMPSWGITEISDEGLASIITYQRNAWGNNNKKDYGKHAGGVVTPEWLHGYRSKIKYLPVKEEERT